MSHAKTRINVINQRFFEIDTYNNFNFTRKKREKRTNENRVVKFITISLTFEKREFENESLTQNM